MAQGSFGSWSGSTGTVAGEPDIVFTNVRIIDGSGEPPFTGEVTVSGNRIAAVVRSTGGYGWTAGGGQRIDGRGMTLMPGLCDAHAHLSWLGTANIESFTTLPEMEHLIVAINNAKLYLDCGYTMIVSAANAKRRMDSVIKTAINNGQIPGPRMLACNPYICTIGNLGDMTSLGVPHLGTIVTGPDQMRVTVREYIREGCDIIKLNVSGEEIVGVGAEETVMDEDEIRMAVHEAKKRNRRCAAHVRSAEGVKYCLRNGVEIIYHASYSDSESMDMLEAAKDRVFVAPGLAWLVKTCDGAQEFGVTEEQIKEWGYRHELEVASETMREMHRRGIRVLPGGDYGFAWTPHGTYAKDLEYFVNLVGMTPMEAIVSATRLGGEIMRMEKQLGLIREGYLADLLLVDGDPLADIRILQDRDRLSVIMKDGKFHKAPAALHTALRASA